ncbi:response regulator [Methanosarcina sp. KYL-1]|uniref:hybrid sensor histidine kinase/response regulator n=1 Tax=Methanosarcina sp. KYL-1 TaxID=2602068 RepID=UPI002101D3FF|nr:response regulator [Methanosarcina sp. KYL-1]MCQ1537072.1 response regulator [Methanosarcina sp. KYL-1]
MENVSKFRFTKVSSELMVILALGFILTLVASNYDLFEAVLLFVERYDRWKLGMLLTLSIYLSFGLGFFSLSRWIETEKALALQKIAEANLRENEEKYRVLFEQSNDMVIISNEKKVLDINKKGREILGCREFCPGKLSLLSLIPPEYLPEAQQALKETFEKGHACFEMNLRKEDLETIYFEVSSSVVDIDRRIIQVVAQDITSRKKAERLEQESRERLKTLIDNALCGILLIEASTRKIMDANPVALKTIGISEKELLGKVCQQFICPPEEEKCISFEMGLPGDVSESVLLIAGGEKIPIIKSVVPVSIGGNAYFVESFIDLSERKKVEEELFKAKIAAEGANRSMSEFLTTMSHELRTPLTAIIGFSDLLIEDMAGEFSIQSRKFLTNISSSGKHLLSLINNILDLSKIEAEEMHLEMEIFALSEVFADTKNVTTPLSFKKNITTIFEVDRNLLVSADRTRFKQILYNLVSNAIKFTPSGGSVKISASRSGEGIRVTVSDTGIGISKKDQEQLFKPFKQIDSALNRQYEGTGLGLALVKKFVEMQGGRVWVESELGTGSTFIFEMPVLAGYEGDMRGGQEGAREKETGTVQTLKGGAGCAVREAGGFSPEGRDSGCDPDSFELPEIIEPVGSDGSEPLVLVVEDDELSRELLILTLTEAGFRVAQASSGKQALLFAHRLKPFVITLDLMLPGMNGWDVLKNLKKDSETAEIPVLIISIDDDRECSILWGAFDHIVKPIEKHTFVALLDRIKAKTKKDEPRILIVDDQAPVVELMASMIENNGYKVSCAYGGQEAIEKALKELPDALILDLMMPGFSGFDVIRVLKRNPKTVDIPIIVCTSKSLSLEEKELLNRNVSFVMKKGDLSRENLIRILNNIGNRGKSHVEAKSHLKTKCSADTLGFIPSGESVSSFLPAPQE